MPTAPIPDRVRKELEALRARPAYGFHPDSDPDHLPRGRFFTCRNCKVTFIATLADTTVRQEALSALAHEAVCQAADAETPVPLTARVTAVVDVVYGDVLRIGIKFADIEAATQAGNGRAGHNSWRDLDTADRIGRRRDTLTGVLAVLGLPVDGPAPSALRTTLDARWQ